MLKKDTYTPSDIAKALNFSEETVRRYLRTGILKGTRIGGKKYVITNEALQDFLGEELYQGIVDNE